MDDTYISQVGRVKLIILANTLMLISGIAVVLPYVLKEAAAGDFHTSLAYAGFVFSFFMFGMLFGQSLNGFLIKLLSLKIEIFLIASVYILCVAAMFLIHDITLLIPVFIILGYSIGTLVTLPFYIVSHSFDDKKRSSHMNILNLFFAIGSFVFPLIAGEMLAGKIDWKYVYVAVLIVWVFIIIMLFLTKLPDVSHAKTDVQETRFSKWTLNVYLVGAVIFLAFMSFMGFTYWLVYFLSHSLHIHIQEATFGLSLFWMLYGGGCLVASIVLRFIKVNKYIMASALLAFVSYFFIFYAGNLLVALISIAVLGLGCSCIYGSCVSFGTLLLENPSPCLVSFFIAASGVGTMAAQFYSSYVQAKFNISAVIKLSALLMLGVFLIILYVSVSEKIKKARKANLK